MKGSGHGLFQLPERLKNHNTLRSWPQGKDSVLPEYEERISIITIQKNYIFQLLSFINSLPFKFQKPFISNNRFLKCCSMHPRNIIYKRCAIEICMRASTRGIFGPFIVTISTETCILLMHAFLAEFCGLLVKPVAYRQLKLSRQ